MFSKRDIVVVNFPFSNFSEAKKRPALILADKEQDYIICAITSKADVDGIDIDEFEEGRSLQFKSKAKYWQIQTVLKKIVVRKLTKISQKNYDKIIHKITEMIK